jgi:hypothetical protein
MKTLVNKYYLVETFPLYCFMIFLNYKQADRTIQNMPKKCLFLTILYLLKLGKLSTTSLTIV